MQKYIYTLIWIVGLFMAMIACDDAYNDALDESDVDYVNNDNQQEPSALDEWLQSNFTIPFNIEVKYQWDGSELDFNRTLVPPKQEKVQDVMDVARRVWIDPYVALAGGNFIKDYCPKQFVLVGSANYNFDGTIQLGTAEGGRKVVLYVVNDFVKHEHYAVKQMIHTIQHEFAHILHQNVMYPAEFKEITPGAYSANWHLVSVSEARSRGFITSYAMASPDEDFVEMVSMMLVEGKEAYEAILACETNADSRHLLRQKELQVVKYFKDAYGIDFYELQLKVQEAINEIAPGDDDGETEIPDPILDLWGFDKTHKTINYDLNVIPQPQPSELTERFNLDWDILRNAGYALDANFKLHFTAENQLTLTLYYYDINAEDREFFSANFKLNVQRLEDNTMAVSYWGERDANGAYLELDLKASYILAYFVNYRYYVVDWEETCEGENLAGLYPVEALENYAVGILSN